MKRIQAAVAAIAVLTALSAERASAQPLGDELRQGREVVGRFLAETGTPGFSVAVRVGDSLVWAEGFGLADVEHDVPVQTFTRFRVASVSKALTSAAVGLLYERGLLDLDAPVQTYVPSFPEKGHPVTTRHLGGHLSGLPHYSADEVVNLVHYESVSAALDKFKDKPLLFPPGERYHYSSYGYNLISAVVEGASGTPFLEYMEEAVFGPLGMERTGADRFDAVVPHRTGFYRVAEEGELRHAAYTDNSDVWAGGGFLSTPSDLVAFASGLLDGDLVEPGTLELLFEPMRTADGEPTGWGLGWEHGEVGGHPAVGHTGGHLGASAFLLAFPEQGVVVAATSNAFDGRFYPMVGELAALFLP